MVFLVEHICKLYLFKVLMHSDKLLYVYILLNKLFLEHYKYLFDPLYICEIFNEHERT